MFKSNRNCTRANLIQLLCRIAEATEYNISMQDRQVATIREIVNCARRITNAVDSSTTAIETESSKVRDDFTKGGDMLDLTEFISEDGSTNLPVCDCRCFATLSTNSS